MTRKELQGISFLTILIIFLWFLPNLYSLILSPKNDDIFTLREKEIQTFLAKNSVKKEKVSTLSISQKEKNKIDPEYFPFNPNTLNTSDGIRLGLSEYQILMIQKYVSKGGKFQRKEDFAKIYALSAEDFQRLSPYITIPEPVFEKQSFENLKTSKITKNTFSEKKLVPPLAIELNKTDSIELQQLKGIGPVFASRIIRFRDLIGGFHDKSQLLSVYGMDEERYERIQEFIHADTTLIQKINVNNADYQRLAKHPFITSKQANVIIQYRKQHGKYSNPTDLLKIAVIDEKALRKIVPYLTFSDD